MTKEDKQLIAGYDGFCGTCKYFKASLCKPTESKNTWDTWFNNDDPADCYRYPPVFVGGDTDDKTEDGFFGSLNWQYPKIYAYSHGCGEYARALWLPDVKS